MIVGLIQAFEEEQSIAGAVASLLAARCDQVVVIDGAWTCSDGSYFGGGEFLSSDLTREEAVAAGARWVEPPEQPFTDGTKRDWAIRNCGARNRDHVLIIDADERIDGLLDDPPAGHGCVILRNDRANDLPFRTPWLDPETRASVPMLRWFRWSRELRCDAPGKYRDPLPIHPYLISELAAHMRRFPLDPLVSPALAALRSVELEIPNEHVSILPIVQGIEISHCIEPTAERVAAKHVYYDAELAAA